jgi:hypothetical protein
MNLDPAAEYLAYEPSLDVRDLIQLSDVMEELNYGPNGGLVFAMQFLMQNFSWVSEQLGDYDEDYLIIDCPGQVELYTHIDSIGHLCRCLQEEGYSVCAVYLVEATRVLDAPSSFLSGLLTALSTMVSLEVPHISVLTKVDLLSQQDQKRLEEALVPSAERLAAAVGGTVVGADGIKRPGPLARLSHAFASVLDEFALVSFLPLNYDDETTFDALVLLVDHVTQFGESEEPKTRNMDAGAMDTGLEPDTGCDFGPEF